MLVAFVETLPIALGIVLATLPLIGVSLLLISRPDRRAYFWFLAGWAIGAGGLGIVAIALSDLSTPGRDEPAVWVLWLRVLLGLALVALAMRKLLKRRTDGDDDEMPAWMRVFEDMGSGGTFLIGAGLAALNPKNAMLYVAGALAIAAKTYVPVAQVTALAGFVAVSSVGLALPYLLVLLLGDRAELILLRGKSLLTRHGATIVAIVLVVLGVGIIMDTLREFPADSGWF